MESRNPELLPWQGEVLRRALQLQQAQHLPHAVLLDTSSERRIDDLAMYLSMLLLCDNPDDLQLCGHCEACRMMAAGTYADFTRVTLEVDGSAPRQPLRHDLTRPLPHSSTMAA